MKQQVRSIPVLRLGLKGSVERSDCCQSGAPLYNREVGI